jgi:hypothetical protein
MWRQQRLRGLELAALAAAEAESPPSEASLKRLLTFARYGARLDGDIGRALRALRSLKGRPDEDLAEAPTRTPEPEPRADEPRPVATPPRTFEPERCPPPLAPAPCTSEPDTLASLAPAAPNAPAAGASAPPRALNRRERRRRAALARKAQHRAA